METYEIKRLTYEMIPDYMNVNIKAWNETYKGIVNSTFLEEIMKNKDYYIKRKQEKFNENDHDYVLYENGVPVGMTSVGKSRIPEFPDALELQTLYLLNKVKNKGYGKFLFQYAVSILKELGYKSMVVACLKDNLPANGFYKHMGGKLVFRRISQIGGEDLEENVYYYENI